MDTDFQPLDNDVEFPEQRPSFLNVLCILSFVSIGLSFLLNVLNFIGGPADEELLNQQKVEIVKILEDSPSNADASSNSFIWGEITSYLKMIETVNENFYAFNAFYIGLLVFGFYAVLNMFHGKRLGFHLYIIYCLLNMLRYYLFLSTDAIPTSVIIWEFFISALFIFLYSRNLYWMNKN
jgi:hypothetical protein